MEEGNDLTTQTCVQPPRDEEEQRIRPRQEDDRLSQAHNPQIPSPIHPANRSPISPNPFHRTELCEQLLNNTFRTVSILNRCAVNRYREEQPKRIYYDMPFASIDLFARVISTFTLLFRELHTLGINYRTGGVGGSVFSRPHFAIQLTVNLTPCSINAPFSKIRPNGAPRKCLGSIHHWHPLRRK